jgi:hypothetical protein
MTAEMTQATYATIGRGITAWSQMEGSLVHIASYLLDSPSEKVGLVLYSVSNFHIWLQIIDELIRDGPELQPAQARLD